MTEFIEHHLNKVSDNIFHAINANNDDKELILKPWF